MFMEDNKNNKYTIRILYIGYHTNIKTENENYLGNVSIPLGKPQKKYSNYLSKYGHSYYVKVCR